MTGPGLSPGDSEDETSMSQLSWGNGFGGEVPPHPTPPMIGERSLGRWCTTEIYEIGMSLLGKIGAEENVPGRENRRYKDLRSLTEARPTWRRRVKIGGERWRARRS